MSQLFASGGQNIGTSAISPSHEYSGLISFRIDWFNRLAVQGTLKNLLQNHSSKASILQCSAFFMVHLSHLYHSFDDTFVGQVTSLLFTLSRFIIAFLSRSKCLIAAVTAHSDFGVKENKIYHCFHFSPSYLP